MIERSAFYPLSFPQKGIWHIEKLFPDTSIGNIAATLRIGSKLDYDALEKAANHFIKMNDAIRIRITEKDGEAMQYVSEYRYQKLDLMDFSEKGVEALYEWDDMTTKTHLYKTDSQLFYFAMIKINDSLGGLYVKLHHLIADAWTLVIFGNELMEYYTKIAGGEMPDTVEKASYIDYVLSEQAYLGSDRYKKDEAYWLDRFSDLPELTTLKERKTNDTYIKAARKTFVLPEKLCRKIRQHCSEHRSSIFSLFLGAMAIYFNRTKSKNEIVFGTPVLNRCNAKEKETMGMFISTVPIRINIDEDQDYTAFAEKINKEWLSILRHQKYPYTLLLKKLREKNPGLGKLYDIVISYQNAKFNKKDDGLWQEGRWHQNGCQTDSLNVHINDREDDGRIVVNYDYLTELFYEKEIESLHDHVIRLLWHSIDNPLRKLPQIEMISEREKRKILFDFNDTYKKYPRNKTIGTLFSEQVKRTPDAVCCVFEDEQLTYIQLDNKANQIARFIRGRNIRPNQVVAVMMHRSPDLLAAIMGVIKSGCAYLPIDPELPNDRIGMMLQDSETTLLFTQSDIDVSECFSDVTVDINDIDFDRYNDLGIEDLNSPNDLVYIIYTSGSTGVPKGVMIEHRALVNFIFGIKDVIDFSLYDRVLSVTAVSFDIFIFEIFTSLLNGSCVILANEEQQKNPVKLKKLISEKKVQIILMTPSRMQILLMEEQYCEFLNDAKTIMLGGEVFPKNIYKKLKHLTSAEIINGYGPTETTIGVSFKVIDGHIINIGRPLANIQIYILDKYLNLLPIGVPGELYIGGDCLARGYIKCEELTHEKFVQNPFKKNHKLYKTGDIARWFSQGEIEYICRTDTQVKIMGYRIEPGEIEKEIINYKGIKEAKVLTVNDDSENKFLCAYIIYDGDISLLDLRKKIAKNLPKYMIPSYFVKLDEIPLTPSGKIDSSSLPKPDISINIQKPHISSRNKTEKTILNIFSCILNNDDIGIDDDFFELGGDSLAAVQLASELNKMDLYIEIHDIYNHPTVREISNFIRDNTKIKQIPYSKGPDITCNINNIEKDRIEVLDGGNQYLPIDSAAVTYIPDDLYHHLNIYNKPMLINYLETFHGKIGLFSIPICNNELYSRKKKLIDLCAAASEIALKQGAKAISLTGLIPSATNYGYDVVNKLAEDKIDVKITTGHTTTAASVILSIERILYESNRDIRIEKVAVLGIGSIGTAVTRLLLSVLPHPASINLCDIIQKKSVLDKFKNEMKTDLLFNGDIFLSFSDGSKLSDDIYDSTLIIGATNVPDILDIDKVNPGTLIIDDSGPHCFSKIKAKQRLQTLNDILFTEGGVLEAPETIRRTVYLPSGINYNIMDTYNKYFSGKNEITGCILSGLLSVNDNNIKTVVGPVELSDCIKNYNILKKYQYRGANLHCEDFVITGDHIENFKKYTGVDKSFIAVMKYD